MAIIVAVLAALLLPATPVSARPSAADLDRRLREAAQQLEVVVEQFNQLREDLRATAGQTQALGDRTGTLETALQHSSERLGRIASDTYRYSGNASMVALLATHSGDRLVGQLTVLDRLARAQQRAVDDLVDAEDRVAVARHTLTALADQQRTQQHRLAAKKTQIEREIRRLKAMRDQASAGGFRVDPPAQPAGSVRPPRYVAGPAARAVAFAFAQLGRPYRWGASGPHAYDCSGLTSAAWARAGVRLPHSSRAQWGTVARLSRAELRPGDLIFYYGGVSHVALYVGGDRMIHAPTYGQSVRVDAVGYQPVRGYGRPR
ncbi:MAG TPA: NlpC/P60 family protein [Catenuloplanes sp.]